MHHNSPSLHFDIIAPPPATPPSPPSPPSPADRTMANGKTPQSQPPFSDVLEAIEKEVGVYTDKDSQERFLRKMLVPNWIADLGERHMKAEVAKYRSSLTSKLKGNTNKLGSVQKGGRGRSQNYGINDLFVLGPRRILKPDFLQRQGCNFGASYKDDSPGSSKHRRPTVTNRPSRTSDTAQSEVDESPASRLNTAPNLPLSPATASPTEAFSIDTGSPVIKEKKRKAAAAGIEEPELDKRRKTGSGSQGPKDETYLEPPSSAKRPIPPLRLKNPSAPASASASRKRSSVAPPTREAESPAEYNAETSSSAAPTQEPNIPTAPTPEAISAAATAAQKPQPPAEIAETISAPTTLLGKHTAADHFQPSGSTADAEELRNWEVLSNVFVKKHKFPPTFMPYRMESEIFPYGDQAWLMHFWGRVENDLWFAMVSLCNEHGFDDLAPSQFVNNPSPELRELYETLVGGKGKWETWAVDQKLRGVECLRQDCTLAGLFRAAVTKILQNGLPWDIQKDFPNQIGERNMKYFESAMRDIGHDYNNVLRNIAAKQFEDKEFQSKDIAELAQRQVGALVLSLQPHIEKLTKVKTPKAALQCKKWTEYLESAFRNAINVKHILQASNMGPFDFPWPEAGVEIDLDEHRPFFEMPGTTHTLHTFLPAVRRVMPDEMVIFSQAVVFSWSLREGQQG